jgi:hypothetical protein
LWEFEDQARSFAQKCEGNSQEWKGKNWLPDQTKAQSGGQLKLAIFAVCANVIFFPLRSTSASL